MVSRSPSLAVVLRPQQAEGVQSALQQWSGAGLISSTLAAELLATIKVQEYSFDWERFSKYSFRLAVLCLAAAVFSLVVDNTFLRLIRKILALPPVVRAVFTAACATAVHVCAFQRSVEVSGDFYLNEAIHGIGAILFALAVVQLGEACNRWRGKAEDLMHLLVLLLALVYGVVGVLAQSNFIWSCGMIMFAVFLGAVTGYL